ncbi:MAG: cupin domain-containing protein [Desulfurococcales archaeon]|nr:cupin domain-containing protein [Desulfurococcales archaeon]
MACGEKVVHFTSVEEKAVPSDMAEGTTIRWLISGDDGARNFYMRLFSMGPGAHIRPHFHPWEHEIYIVSGSGRVRIGSRTYSVGEGFAIYIPPNVEHEYWSGEEGLRFICVIPARPTAEEREEPVEC